jgi:hypothetical protein
MVRLMPRVYTKTKNRGGKKLSYSCSRCPEPILPGQTYHEWSFRYGPKMRQHTQHGLPRRSQLTMSKMSGVYAAVEEVEDLISAEEFEIEAAKSAMEDAASTIREVASEYEEAAEPFGYSGENQERYEALDGWADEFENFDLPEREDGESEEDYRDTFRMEVESILTDEPF